MNSCGARRNCSDKRASAIVGWAWYEMHRVWVKHKLAEPSTHVLVATLPDLDEAIGWCAVTEAGERPLIVHYVYVLSDARDNKVAHRLMAAARLMGDGRTIRHSHMTQAGGRLITEDARGAA